MNTLIKNKKSVNKSLSVKNYNIGILKKTNVNKYLYASRDTTLTLNHKNVSLCLSAKKENF